LVNYYIQHSPPETQQHFGFDPPPPQQLGLEGGQHAFPPPCEFEKKIECANQYNKDSSMMNKALAIERFWTQLINRCYS
jgi:hypothetical protein